MIYLKVLSLLPASLGDQKVTAYNFMSLGIEDCNQGSNITVVDRSPWLASAAFFLAVMHQFK